MAASLGRLTLDLVTRIGEYTEPLDKAERHTKKTTSNMSNALGVFGKQVSDLLGGTALGQSLSGITDRLGGLRGGFVAAGAAAAGMAAGGVVLATGALAAMSVELAKADAELSRLAARGNASTQNFQVLAAVSQKFGIEQDKLGDILADTKEKLGEYTATGGGEAKEFFDMLQNNSKMSAVEIQKFSKELSQMDTVDAISAMTAKLDEMGASAAEKRFVLESLASDLGDLAPVFANNSALLGEYSKALQDAGVIRSKEAIEQSKILAAQTSGLQTRFQGFKNQLAEQVTPILSNLIQHFVDGADKSGAFADVLTAVSVVAKGVAIAIIGVSGAISALVKIVGGYIGLVKTVGTTLGEFFAAEGLQAKAAVLANGFRTSYDIMADAGKGAVDSVANAIRGASSVLDGANAKLDVLAQANLKSGQAANDAAAGIKLNAKAAEEQAKASEKAAKAKDKERQAQEDLNKMVGVSALKGLRISGAKAVDGGGVRGYTAEFAKVLQDALGGQLTRFTAFNDSFHKTGRHPLGQAFDFQIKDAAQSEQALNTVHTLAKKYGFVIKTLDEYKHKSKNWTGPHLHISVLGFKGGKEALDNAKAEAGLLGDAAKSAAEAVKQAQEEAKERAEIQARYFAESQKRQAEHEQMMADIRNGGFSSAEQSKLLKQEETRYKREEALADAKQNKELADMQAFRQTERDQITYRYKYELDIAQQSNDELKDIRIRALKQQRDEELAALDRRNQMQMLDAEQGYGFETELMLKKYALERDEIIKNAKLDEAVRQAMLLKNERDRFAAMDAARGKIGQRGMDAAAAVFQRNNPDAYAAWDLQNQYSSAMGGLGTDYLNVTASINAKDRDGNYLIADVEERNRQLLEAEQAFQAAKFATAQEYAQKSIELENARKLAQLDNYQSIFGSMTSIAADAFGKQSAAYRAMFAIEKGFAVAKAMMNMQLAMSQAMTLPFPANLGAIASVASQMATIVGTIKGVSAPTGMAHSGLDYIPREGTWLLDKGERVLSPRQNRDLTEYLSNRSQQGGNITINNHAGAEVQATQHPDGSVTIDVVRRMIDGKFNDLRDPNSHASKSIQRNFDTRVKR